MKSQSDGSIEYIAGRSRTGKTLYTSRQTKKDNRLIVYDPKGDRMDYPGCAVFYVMSEFIDALIKVKDKNARLRFIDKTANNFDAFCSAALAWCQVKRCTVVVDELASVTSPGKAPPGWGNLIRQGMGFGVRLIAITHRPAESDKTALANATRLTCFYLRRPIDRKTMSAEMGIEQSVLDDLVPLVCVSYRDGHQPEIIKIKI